MAHPLFAEVDGPVDGPRIVLAHGFTQTRDCWGALPSRLVESGWAVVRVDLPGHGRSGRAEADLGEAADRLGVTGGRATYLGYSFGARVALHLALARPDLVERLVLVSATGGIDDPHERAARRTRDEALADRIERVGVDAFLEEWLRQPLFAGLNADTDCHQARRENAAAGLAASLRRCGTGTQEPLWARLGELTMPVLVVAGQLDTKFAASARRLAAGVGPGASLALVPDAGHTPHLEAPGPFCEVLSTWLARP